MVGRLLILNTESEATAAVAVEMETAEATFCWAASGSSGEPGGQVLERLRCPPKAALGPLEFLGLKVGTMESSAVASVGRLKGFGRKNGSNFGEWDVRSKEGAEATGNEKKKENSQRSTLKQHTKRHLAKCS